MPILEQVPGFAEISEEDLRSGYTQFEIDRMNASKQRASQRGKGKPALELNTIPVETRNESALERARRTAAERGLGPHPRRVAGLDGSSLQSIFNQGIDQLVRRGSRERLRDRIILLINRKGLAEAKQYIDACPLRGAIIAAAGDLL